MTQATPSVPREQLENAFQVFNQVSERLTASYSHLQDQVRQLSEQLAAARSERMWQLAETERLAHRLAQLLDALPAAVVVLDGDELIHQYNPAAASLLPGIDDESHWPTLYQKLFHPDQSGSELELNSGQVVSFTERTLSPDAGRILLLLDMTETRQLQVRMERQQRLSAMGEMAAQLAHQIRTPLSSALLYNAHLSRDDLDHEQRERFSTHSQARLRHIERQINDMLAFARGGQYEVKTVNLGQLLQELVQTLEAPATQRNVTIQLSGMEDQDISRIKGNHSALLGAMVNIASNALEHSPEGSRIEIELRDDTDTWQVLFRDQGPGVPENLYRQIFEPFFTTRSDGTGLGLAVAQTVVLSHRGRIGLCRQSAEGACFSLNLPKQDFSEVIHPLPGNRKIIDETGSCA